MYNHIDRTSQRTALPHSFNSANLNITLCVCVEYLIFKHNKINDLRYKYKCFLCVCQCEERQASIWPFGGHVGQCVCVCTRLRCRVEMPVLTGPTLHVNYVYFLSKHYSNVIFQILQQQTEGKIDEKNTTNKKR